MPPPYLFLLGEGKKTRHSSVVEQGQEGREKEGVALSLSSIMPLTEREKKRVWICLFLWRGGGGGGGWFFGGGGGGGERGGGPGCEEKGERGEEGGG